MLDYARDAFQALRQLRHILYGREAAIQEIVPTIGNVRGVVLGHAALWNATKGGKRVRCVGPAELHYLYRHGGVVPQLLYHFAFVNDENFQLCGSSNYLFS